jgi:hypothetical protein
MEKAIKCTPGAIEKGVVVMYVVLSASRLMKASEIREICAELRSNPTLLTALELAAKEKLYQRFGQKEKAAS